MPDLDSLPIDASTPHRVQDKSAGSRRRAPPISSMKDGSRPDVASTTMWQVAKRSVTAWMDDYAPSMGAALAYYTLFSLAPLLLLVISVAGLVFGAEAARGQVVTQFRGLIGEEGAVAVQGLLKSASHSGQGVAASLIGLVTLIVGATSVFAELQSDLDRIWRVPTAAKPSGIRGMLRIRLLSFGLVVSIGFLLLVSLLVSVGLAAFSTVYGALFPGWVITMQIVNQVVSLAFVTVLFAMMYRILPSARVAWQDVWYGAIVTAVLFTIGKFLIGLYVGTAGIASGFGAAGSIVFLLVWVFYSAQIFLLGAEFTWLYAHSHGSRAAETALPEEAAPEETSSLRPLLQPMPRVSPRATAHDVAIALLVWLGFGALGSLLRVSRASLRDVLRGGRRTRDRDLAVPRDLD
jgi:membrane protein